MYPFDLIVLIDDDPINNLINKRLINKLNLTPKTIEFLEAEQALEYLKNPDLEKKVLILVDINMPVMNGWDFLSQYVELENQRNDRIIMLSSSIDFQDRQKSKEFPFVSGFIEKPLTHEKLETFI
ncbi:CheY chemotaxis protein or a CheY-like REC (receiver) domain [Cyclobacterium lianum]|uniref:CheY chemotaxis protein or a CheY-like REC (Receiver) domain n=1 Tax=Cyclobacterium lianum TaxID=388280 RepID=A0A1M7PA27_9BACT|nr:response regulator [Cyclobacterium lianum]SHN13600.1 CheY chemotaxis protein or a CheY-like REC (receiver) domain [Cyclobacterium lianum]